jgi:hypothetical protein
LLSYVQEKESLCTTAAGDGNGDGITGTELRALIIISYRLPVLLRNNHIAHEAAHANRVLWSLLSLVFLQSQYKDEMIRCNEGALDMHLVEHITCTKKLGA